MKAVLVIGAGAAGTGAALASARAGMHVTVADGGTGASTLATGALDVRFWQDASAEPLSLEPAAREALDKLEGYVLPQEGAILLSVSGIARRASGYDAALLNVRGLAGQRVGVVRCDRPGWDARSLALAWGERYEPIDVAIVRHSDERVLPDADFATRHDDSGRLEWLADRLREALAPAGRMAALVLPPCLGVDRARARELSELVGIPCGEPISLPGGPSGLRFERARDRALSAAFVERRQWRARRVQRGEGIWRVAMEDGAVAESDAVVFATGGLIGGGLEYTPAESVIASALPPSSRPAFRLTIDAPLTLAAFGRELEMPSTLFGSEPEAIAWPFSKDALMERVGVLADRDGRASSRGRRTGPTGDRLFVCGDLVADGSRTWLDAFATGVACGLAAAQGLLSERSRLQSPDVGPPIRP